MASTCRKVKFMGMFPCLDLLGDGADSSSGTPFLSQPAGKDFTKKLWAELVVEFAKIRPELGIYACKDGWQIIGPELLEY